MSLRTNVNILHLIIKCCVVIFLISFRRLKLSPDERRSQQTSAISGEGTLLIDQQFLFQVFRPICPEMENKTVSAGSRRGVREQKAGGSSSDLQERNKEECLLV